MIYAIDKSLRYIFLFHCISLLLFHFWYSDIFSLGFGPFRWVCTSGDPTDLHKTDQIATEVLNEIIKSKYLIILIII